MSSRIKWKVSADSDACTKIFEKACSQLEEIGQRMDSQAFGLDVAESLWLIPEEGDLALYCWYNTSCILPPSKADRLTNLQH